jgi:nucleotide-binding universal stress UspA family protein
MSRLSEFGLSEALFPQAEPYERWKDELAGAGITPKKIPDLGFSCEKILRAARDEKASLLVVNLGETPGDSRGRALIQKLINRSHIPVLFIKDNVADMDWGNLSFFSHVIFAVNWAASSQKAFKRLIALKKIVRQLEIINVVEQKLTIQNLRKIKQRLAETRRLCLDQHIDAEAHIYAGKLCEEVLTAARDYKGTLILMGGRARKTPVKDLFVKNDLYKIVENSDLPVWIF